MSGSVSNADAGPRMMGVDRIAIDVTSDVAGCVNDLLALCHAAFDDFDPAYLRDRLPYLVDPLLVTASTPDGTLAAFKLGYRREPTLLFSWLGAVHPDARRLGLAARLMTAQHAAAREGGYGAIETRTRGGNRPMLILNLKSGFSIVGFEVDRRGLSIVTQRISLNEG